MNLYLLTESNWLPIVQKPTKGSRQVERKICFSLDANN